MYHLLKASDEKSSWKNLSLNLIPPPEQKFCYRFFSIIKKCVDSLYVTFHISGELRDDLGSQRIADVISTETGYGDVQVSSTGYVTYVKNAGEVYVRAYAKADGYNPTGYTYAKVQYGASDIVNPLENTLTVDKTSVIVKVGEKAEIKASANTAISFKSDDESIATVASAGSIVVTGVKKGQTNITVTAAADDKNAISAKTITIPVVVTDADNAVVTAPAKVTGLKVKNKKGAKVSVTWTAQDKTVLYRVYKKVGSGKWKAKNVTGAKATLEVKKGAKVQVKVKAFRRDENGKAVWQSGKATKAKAFKTDKK